MAELFLEGLEPEFLARAPANFTYDFIVGFTNPQGGATSTAVQVKATENLTRPRIPVERRRVERWAHSNLPVILLVADAKQNRLFYAWMTPEVSAGPGHSARVSVPLPEITDDTKQALRSRLSG